MRLSGWTWIIFGAIVTVVSGYIYLFIPKNGQPNYAMALFFFVGIIFIVIGIANIFFTKSSDKSMVDALNYDKTQGAINQSKPIINNAPMNGAPNANSQVINNRPNRVDETISQLARQQEQPSKPAVQNPTQAHHQASNGHSNTFYQSHQFKGPVHEQSQSVHAQHPVSQHIQQGSSSQTASQSISQSTQHHPVQNSEHGLRCKKCGNVNAGHANYCHSCGNRLR